MKTVAVWISLDSQVMDLIYCCLKIDNLFNIFVLILFKTPNLKEWWLWRTMWVFWWHSDMYCIRLTNPQKGLLVRIPKTNGDRGRKFYPETNYNTLPGFEPDAVQLLNGSVCKMGMTSYPFWIRFWSWFSRYKWIFFIDLGIILVGGNGW